MAKMSKYQIGQVYQIGRDEFKITGFISKSCICIGKHGESTVISKILLSKLGKLKNKTHSLTNIFNHENK